MCEKCRSNSGKSPLDGPEAIDRFLTQSYLYGQDLAKREMERDDAAKNACDFVEKLGVEGFELRMGISFVQFGYENRHHELTKEMKGKQLMITLLRMGEIDSVMSILGMMESSESPEESGSSDETIH